MKTERVFSKALKALGGSRGTKNAATGRWVMVPTSPEYPGTVQHRPRVPAAERRRRNLSFLAAFIIGTFVLGLLPVFRVLLFVNLGADIVLIAYLVAVLVFAARPVAVRQQPTHDGRLADEGLRHPEAAGYASNS